MKKLESIFLFLSHESKSIGLNTDIFETNVINLILLLSLVFYVGKDFLGSTLTERQRAILDKIDASLTHKKVALGSLVKSNGMLLFISTALPKLSIENKTIFALSPQSPLGIKLMGNEVGFEFDMNGKPYTIESVI
jgi:hypothetical protein